MSHAAARITVRHADKNHGPYAREEVRRLLDEGKFSANDLAWVEGTPEWTRLGYVPGMLPPVPPPMDRVAMRDAEEVSDRTILPAFILAFLVGIFGVHRFYVGKTGTGVVMLLLTLTVVGAIVTGIWATIDWIIIVCGGFRDAEGRRLENWT